MKEIRNTLTSASPVHLPDFPLDLCLVQGAWRTLEDEGGRLTVFTHLPNPLPIPLPPSKNPLSSSVTSATGWRIIGLVWVLYLLAQITTQLSSRIQGEHATQESSLKATGGFHLLGVVLLQLRGPPWGSPAHFPTEVGNLHFSLDIARTLLVGDQF